MTRIWEKILVSIKPRRKQVILSVSISLIVIFIYFSSRYFGSFLGLEVDNTSAFFLALIPLAIYLILSGAITEFRGGGFELKFKEAATKNVLFASQEVYYQEQEPQRKRGFSELHNMIKDAREGKPVILGLFANNQYAPFLFKKYLRELSQFESAKYVVFRTRENEFKGFVSVKNLLDLVNTHKDKETKEYDGGRYVVELIKEGRLREIPGFRTEIIQNFVSNRDVLKVLEEKGIPDIAVTNVKGEFLGFTDKNTILLSIFEKLLEKI